MGTHRSDFGGRGLARWVIAAFAAVVVLILIIVGVWWLGNVSDREGQEAAASCVRGDMTVPVIVTPALVEPLERAAAEFNESGTVSEDFCAKVAITGMPADTALAQLTGTWPAESGPVPALWIPETTVWTARLVASNPGALTGQPTSIASSPVVLAVPARDAAAFNDVGWLDLPGKQTELRVAVPHGDAGVLAGLSVASALARTGGAPISDTAASSPLVNTTLTRWADAAPKTPTLAELAAGSTKARALPILEQALFAADGAAFTAVTPRGATASATYPAAVLGRPEVSDAQRHGAADFLTFLTKDGNAKPLADAGFRVPNVPMPSGDSVVAFGPVDPLATPSNAAVLALADAVSRR